PPNPNPALSIEGITATHSALSKISSGIPLSGAAMISLTILAASSRRSSNLARSPSVVAAAMLLNRATSAISDKTFLITTPDRKFGETRQNVLGALISIEYYGHLV